jgi:hypothetical protein
MLNLDVEGIGSVRETGDGRSLLQVLPACTEVSRLPKVAFGLAAIHSHRAPTRAGLVNEPLA